MTQTFSPLMDAMFNPVDNVVPENAVAPEKLEEWRKISPVLNATSRLRYTADLKSKKAVAGDDVLENGKMVTRFRTVAHVLRAVQRFKEAAQTSSEGPVPDHFAVGPSQLVQLMKDQEADAFEQQGGVQDLAKKLKSNIEHGIDDDDAEVEKRKAAFGSNKIPSKPGKNYFVFVLEACQHIPLIMLMICAVVSFGTEMSFDGPKKGWHDGVSIGAAVLVVIAVTATIDYRQSLQFRSLSDEKKNIQIEVIRGGRRCRISVFDVVVGDVVFISTGDQVPADGILISRLSLTIAEPTMTAESIPVDQVFKNSKQPFLLSGCKIVDGYGTMLVTAVGTNTEWGKVMSYLTEDNEIETPLQVRLLGVAGVIGQIGLSVAVLVFLILTIRFFAVDFNSDRSASDAVKKIVNSYTIAVAIFVVAAGDGLPLAVTQMLSYSVRKMMNDKAMIQNLAACETMGTANTICTGKTGILTLNQMSVVKSLVAGEFLEPQDVKAIPVEIYKTLLIGVCQNSSGSVFNPKGGGKPEVSGSQTESAALSWGLTIGMNFDEIKHTTDVILVEAFNPTRRKTGVAVSLRNGEFQAHWKGAAEMILDISDRWVDVDGVIQPMTQDKAMELRNNIEGMAAASLRCIAFAYRQIDPEDVEEVTRTGEIPDVDLIFMSVIGIKDPCRPGVQAAVARCQAAGVKVRMVTGDSVTTAKAIAQECGLLTTGGEVIEGKVFRNFSDEELNVILPKLDVMAGSSPTDKLSLVGKLKARGEVVAVTGDGPYDVLALHDADVGLSMGIAGREIAMGISNIVILDDNFASIVKVLHWGRSVYSNIQKFIQFQFTVIVTLLVISFAAAVKSGRVPLNVVQLLWVTLIVDTLGALALATEAPTDDLMEKKPVGWREPLITNMMWRNLFGQVIYQIVVLMTIDFGGKMIFKLENERVKNTIVFNVFVLFQVFNEVNARRPEKVNIFQGLQKNYLFMSIILVEVVLQFLVVQFMRNFASTSPLNWQQWLICIAIGSIAWPLGCLLKLLPVREKPYVNIHCTLTTENVSSPLHPREPEGEDVQGKEMQDKQEYDIRDDWFSHKQRGTSLMGLVFTTNMTRLGNSLRDLRHTHKETPPPIEPTTNQQDVSIIIGTMA